MSLSYCDVLPRRYSESSRRRPALQDAAEITPVKQLRRMELKTPVRGGTSDPQTPAKGVAGAAKFECVSNLMHSLEAVISDL